MFVKYSIIAGYFIIIIYNFPKVMREGGHILPTGLPSIFCWGRTPKTRESTDTSWQSPRTYTSSSANSAIFRPLPLANNRSMSRRGSSSHKFRFGPTAACPSMVTSLVLGSRTMFLSPGMPTTRLTKSELGSIVPAMSVRADGGRNKTMSPR